jgi:hypothetical protein
MRVRVSPLLEQRIHTLALRQSRSDQAMLDKLIEAGLEATGMPAAVMAPAIGDLPDSEMSMIKVPLAPALRAGLRELADREGRSQRQMAAMVIDAGLKAIGADAAARGGAIEA